MHRAGGRLVVIAPDGRQVWGAADAAFAGGVSGLAAPERTEFAGVHPIDSEVGRRPATPAETEPAENRSTTERLRTAGGDRLHRRTHSTRRFAGPAPVRPARSGRPWTLGTTVARRRRPCDRPDVPIGATLFPDGEPRLPDALPASGERMDVRYVVGVLMGNRDLVRRLAAEAAGIPAGTS